jgi:hypothetical protein
MASGRQLAEQNWAMFCAWQASKTEGDYRQMVSRGVLSRKEIATECGFAKSALDQNPRIKEALRLLEDSLRDRGVLPRLSSTPDAAAEQPLMREASGQRSRMDAERQSRLEQENASLRAENAELKRQLTRYAVLQEALNLTGRLPR